MSGDRIVAFAGPSLPAAFRPDGPFEWRPPAVAGDVLALLPDPPARLCLIDGLFDSCPAPWHKELLLLMARGTLVFGAASMGALRAAELDGFGMIGVGAIYRAYRGGRLTGDDEVALIHATEALDWAPLSVPMVEIRATLAAACRSGLLPVTAARLIRDRIRVIYYAERDWPLIEKLCREDGLVDAATLRHLAAMHVPLKRRDALACIAAAMERAAPRHVPEPPPTTCFLRRLAADRGIALALELSSTAERRLDALEESPGQICGKGMVAPDPN